jgi:site-specific recombinase XerD
MEESLDERFISFLKKDLCDNSIIDYHGYFKKLDPNITITQDIVNKFLMKHNNSKARGMILKYIEFLEYEGHENINIKIPKIKTKRKKRIIYEITDDELNKLRDSLKSESNTHNKRDWLLFELIYQGALRRFEVEGIKFDSFNWEKWLKNPESPIDLRIIGKGDKEREVLINSEVAGFILNEIKEKHNIHEDNIKDFLCSTSTLLFPKIYGRKVYRIISENTKKIMNRPIRPHELRHQKATGLYEIGVDIYDIKNYLGHSSIATTEIYVRKSEKDSLNNIREKMG